MKTTVIVSAVLLALFGLLAAATSPNPSDHLAGNVLVLIAAAFVVLAVYASPKVTTSVYLGAIALVIIAYSLPLSFLRIVGLSDDLSCR